MRKLCLFSKIGVVAVLAAIGIAQGEEPATRCASLGYYDSTGRLIASPLLAAPLMNGTRISDEYGLRLHPILNRLLMHLGVDIAAPTGTPIHAVADGVVVAAARYGPSGLYIRVRHGGVYETAFAHLSAFGDGIRPGAHVRKGQVVAFVGSTGLSTGPHLHFEIFVRRSRVRPACRCGVMSATAGATPQRVALLPAKNRHLKPSPKPQPLKGGIDYEQTNRTHGN